MKLETSKKNLCDLRPKMRELGFCISAWCRRHGYNRRTAELALSGRRNGKLSREIRSKVKNLK